MTERCMPGHHTGFRWRLVKALPGYECIQCGGPIGGYQLECECGRQVLGTYIIGCPYCSSDEEWLEAYEGFWVLLKKRGETKGGRCGSVRT